MTAFRFPTTKRDRRRSHTSQKDTTVFQLSRRSLQWIVCLAGIHFLIGLWYMVRICRFVKPTLRGFRGNPGPTLKVISPHAKRNAFAALKRTPYPSIRIEVIANNRLASLQRLLASLKRADYMDASVPLDIHLEANESASLLDMVVAFTWPFGCKQVHLRHSEGGLINAVLESWFPASMEEMAIFLEDDIEVSPLFFRWVTGVLDALQGANGVDPSVVGISLYTPRVGELQHPRTHVDFTKAMLLSGQRYRRAIKFQLPCSLGALYFPGFWKEFRSYALLREASMFDEQSYVIPESRSTGWSASWKKYAIELFWSKGYCLVYPNFPNQSSLVTNHLEPGAHIGSSTVKHLPEDYTVPLLKSGVLVQEAIQEMQEEGTGQLPRFDLFGTPVLDWERTQAQLLHPPSPSQQYANPPCTEKLRAQACQQFSSRLNKHTSSGSKISIVLAHMWSRERAEKLEKLIEYYADSTIVEKIFIVWHNWAVSCPANTQLGSVPVIFSCQTCDSLNNRFLLDMRLTTEAVFITDDDIQVHLDDLKHLFLTWQYNQEMVVGLFPRWVEVQSSPSASFVYKNALPVSSPGYSFILTKAMIVHKTYLYEYRCGLGLGLHDIVDMHMNGEDIAFNLMVAKLTGRVPALFVQPEWPVVDYGTFGAGGIHTRSKDHYAVRSYMIGKIATQLNTTFEMICCQNETVVVRQSGTSYSHGRGSIKHLIPYVLDACKDFTTPGLCEFIPYSKLGRIAETTLQLAW